MDIKTKKKESKLKLDLYDKKIILSLSQNARKPKTQLAKELGISIQRLEYKTKRLYDSVIHPVMILNYDALDISSYFIFAETLDQESLNKLEKSDHIFFLAEFVGRYKYLIYVLTDDISEFKIKNLGDNIVKTYLSTDFQNDDYNPFNLDLPVKNKQEKQTDPKLTKDDYKILSELFKSPLENYITLAEKTSLDWRTVKTRMDIMRATGVIDRFKIALNIFKMGFLFYFVTIEVPEKSKAKIKQVIKKDSFSGLLHESHDEFLMMYMPPTYEELLDFVKKLEFVCDKVKTDINQIVNFKVESAPKFILEELEARSK